MTNTIPLGDRNSATIVSRRNIQVIFPLLALRKRRCDIILVYVVIWDHDRPRPSWRSSCRVANPLGPKSVLRWFKVRGGARRSSLRRGTTGQVLCDDELRLHRYLPKPHYTADKSMQQSPRKDERCKSTYIIPRAQDGHKPIYPPPVS
jgi:hypothetical protein